jgi:hypothetical protein
LPVANINESLSTQNADDGEHSITTTILWQHMEAVPLMLSFCVAMAWPPIIGYIDHKGDGKTGLGADVALHNRY